MRAMAIALALFAALPFAGRAAAQPWPGPTTTPTEADQKEARRLYADGVARIEGGEPSAGLSLLADAYAKSGAPLPLYSLAVTLHAMKEYVRAHSAFLQLFAEHADLPADLRADARQRFDDARARIAVLVVGGLPEQARASLRVNARDAADSGERPLEVGAAPGEITVEAAVGDRVAAPWRGTVAAGERRPITLTWAEVAQEPAAPLPAPATLPASPSGASAAARDDGTVLESPWFWGAVGLVFVGTAAVILGVTAGSDDALAPRSDHVIRL